MGEQSAAPHHTTHKTDRNNLRTGNTGISEIFERVIRDGDGANLIIRSLLSCFWAESDPGEAYYLTTYSHSGERLQSHWLILEYEEIDLGLGRKKNRV